MCIPGILGMLVILGTECNTCSLKGLLTPRDHGFFFFFYEKQVAECFWGLFVSQYFFLILDDGEES